MCGPGARSRSRGLVSFAAAFVLVAAVSPAWASREGCPRAVVEALRTTERLALQQVSACLDRHASDRALHGGDVGACVTADPAQRVARMTTRLAAVSSSRCGSGPDPAYDPFDTYAARDVTRAAGVGAVQGARLARALFADLDTSLATFATDERRARCQLAGWRAAARCTTARLDAFHACVAAGLRGQTPPGPILRSTDIASRCLDAPGQPDPRGAIAAACGGGRIGIAATLRQGCQDDVTTAAFPGCSAATSADEMAECIRRASACRVCESINEGAETGINCDRFDDGRDDGSCGCGDGILTPAEECDGGDDCTPECRWPAPVCPCFSTADLDALFPRGSLDELSCQDSEALRAVFVGGEQSTSASGVALLDGGSTCCVFPARDGRPCKQTSEAAAASCVANLEASAAWAACDRPR